ncbi:Dishevelled associated activator of morphogenesis isoform B, partial [Danaus plexippus plexippus]
MKSSKLVSPVASSTPIDIKSKPQEAAHAVNCSDVESPISS